MKLFLELGVNWCCNNLSTIDKVTIIILDKYK